MIVDKIGNGINCHLNKHNYHQSISIKGFEKSIKIWEGFILKDLYHKKV